MSNSDGALGAVKLRIPDMDCPSCVEKIRGHLGKLEGVRSIHGSPVARTLTVEHDPRLVQISTLRHEVHRLGYMSQDLEDEGFAPVPFDTWTGIKARIAYASMGLFVIGLLQRFFLPDPRLGALPYADLLLSDLLFITSALVGGWNFFPKGIRAARAAALDMNFLMTVAILGAIAIGETVEAAAIAFLFAIAELLETYSVDRARASVESLVRLAPDTAIVLRDGVETKVTSAELAPGDVVVLRPGDRVPADGVVVDGASAMDQSPITGESIPVDKSVGDEVFAGAVNRDGWAKVRVERRAAQSAIARIARLVDEAAERKTHQEQFIERFARWYTPAVAMGAVLVMAIPPLFLGAPTHDWILRGLTLLVIACPCALVISTPVAVVSGMTAAARRGVLVKGGVHLEAMASVRAMAFDKTGTLTFGHPELVGVYPVGQVDPDDALARAAALESRSEHPLARAVVEASTARGLSARYDVTSFSSVPGKGARGTIDGVVHLVGRPEILEHLPTAPPPEAAGGGATLVAVATETSILAWLAIADRPRDSAADVVRRLRANGIRAVCMLTGDSIATAEAVGSAVGVDRVAAGLLPEQKVEVVKSLEADYGSVAMVGDGVNDAPALAVATVGIAMGAAGSDTALETADIALMGDDLDRLPYLIDLSRRADRVIRQNISAALLVKLALAVGVPLGAVSLIAAVVIGDLGVSLAVTLNALRLGRVRTGWIEPD